jgi:hypothetical protein
MPRLSASLHSGLHASFHQRRDLTLADERAAQSQHARRRPSVRDSVRGGRLGIDAPERREALWIRARRRQHQVVAIRVVMRGNEDGTPDARGIHLAQQLGGFERRLAVGCRAGFPRTPGRVGRPDVHLRIGDEHAG